MLIQKGKPYDLKVPLLCIHPRKFNTYYHTKMCMEIFIKDFINNSQTCKNPNVHQWVSNKANWYTSVLKNNNQQ